MNAGFRLDSVDMCIMHPRLTMGRRKMTTTVKSRRTTLMLIVAGLAAAVGMLLKVIVIDLPKVADAVIPMLKVIATS